MDAKAQNYIALCQAINRQDKEAAYKLIMDGAQLNLPSGDPDDSPLHKVIEKFTDSEIIQLLLKNGADITLKNQHGETPLHVAVQEKNEEALRLLLEHGHYKPAEISEALKTATSNVDPALVSIIIQYSSEIKPRLIPIELLLNKSQKATSCIHHYLTNGFKVHVSNKDISFNLAYNAVESGDLQILEKILESDIDVNKYHPKTRLTLLHLACIKRNVELVSLLIKHKAKFDLKVLHAEKDSNQSKPIEETQVMAGRMALYIAVENFDFKITELLVKSGALTTIEPDLIKIAIEKKNKEMIELLLSLGVQINQVIFQGITPLHYAIVSYFNFFKCGMSEWDMETDSSDNADSKYPIVELLLKHGANVDAQTGERNQTSLHVAVEKNYPNIVELLLKNNANVNLVDSDNLTPFHVAIFKRREIIIDIFLRSDIDLNVKNEFGSTLLHVSCSTGDEKAVHELLKKNVSVNCVDKYGRTPLHNACETGKFAIINHLLDYKANVNIKDKYSQTPFHILARIRIINSYDTGEDLIKICERFISMGADINELDAELQTPFFTACLFGCREVIEVLLKHKADIHRPDIYGRPPVFAAAGKAAKNTGILKLLIDNNANADYTDRNRNTIIHTAAAANNSDFDEIMDKIDVDINAINSEGNTALHIASKKGFFKVVYFLINNGADINIVNSENKTPVHVAVHRITTLRYEIEEYREQHGFNDFTYDNRHLYYEFGIDDYKDIIGFFYSLTIQLHKANFYVHPDIFKIIRIYTKRDMSEFEDACTLELQNMKESRISGTNWYNHLTCCIHDIAKFANNEDVQTVIMYNTVPKFPLYHDILNIRFKQGIRRNKWMKFIQLYHCSKLSIFKGLPYSCVDQIFRYFDINNILTFKDAVTGRYNK